MRTELIMLKSIRSLAVVSRPEFIPANSASLVVGLAWAINPPVDFLQGLVIPLSLSSLIITLVAAVGAQLNTMFDYELDSMDSRKKPLVDAMGYLGRNRLKLFMIFELLLSLAFLSLLLQLQGKPALILIWIAGAFLAYAYSSPPLRFKSRSWLALGTMLLVLCILPILFVFYTFASELNPLFLLFLAGHALTVYGVIVPAEIRDYFGDRAMAVESTTVRLGLVKASFFGMLLLIAGGLLSGTAFLLGLTFALKPVLSLSLLAMMVSEYFVLREYKAMYTLSKRYMSGESKPSSNGESHIAQEIIKRSEHNPKWITMITQTVVLMGIVLLVAKFLP